MTSRISSPRSSPNPARADRMPGPLYGAPRWDTELEERASPAPLLQTWAWGLVQARSGWSIERLRLPGGAMASVQVRSVGPVREAYVPRRPVPSSPDAVDALVTWAKGHGIARLVIEPETPASLTD